MTRYMTGPVRFTLLFAFFLCCVGGTFYFKQDFKLQAQKTIAPSKSLYYLPSPKTLSRSSLGFRTLLADLIWVRGLLYVGNHFSRSRGHIEWLPRYVKAITALDPKFYKAYIWGSVLLLYNRHNVSRKQTEQSVYFLEQGRKQFPDDFNLPRLLAMSYLFEIKVGKRSSEGLKLDYERFCKRKDFPKHLPRIKQIKAIRRCLRKTAASYMMEAATKEGAPDDLVMIAAGLMRRNKRDKLAICNHMLDILWRAGNDEVRKQAQGRIKKYCGPKELHTILCNERLFRRRWRKKYPYLTTTLFALVEVPEEIQNPNLLQGLSPPPNPCLQR